MPNGLKSPLHPRPALSPSGALKYAARASNLLPGFTVEEEHAVPLCERDIENRRVPFFTKAQKLLVDTGKNAQLS